MERRWASVIPSLDEFQRHLDPRVTKLPIQFADDSTWSNEQYELEAKKGTYRKCGVYLIFDANEELQYIGVAMDGFSKRIWMHDAEVDRRFTDLIPFPPEHYFLAPALEFFLLCRLRPSKNKVYREYTIPAWQLDEPASAGGKD